jgi:hypothetical protein
VYDGVGVVSERHEHVNGRVEERSGCESADVAINRAECEGAPGSAIGVSVHNHLINKVLDLGREKCCATQGGQSSQGFARRRS